MPRKIKHKHPGVKKKPINTGGRGNPTYVTGNMSKKAQKIAREFEQRMRELDQKYNR